MQLLSRKCVERYICWFIYPFVEWWIKHRNELKYQSTYGPLKGDDLYHFLPFPNGWINYCIQNWPITRTSINFNCNKHFQIQQFSNYSLVRFFGTLWVAIFRVKFFQKKFYGPSVNICHRKLGNRNMTSLEWKHLPKMESRLMHGPSFLA